MHTAEQKAALREATAERLLRMAPDERTAESRSLCRRLEKLLPTGLRVCAFVPLKTEPDISPLIKALLARGDSVFLPVFSKNHMLFRRAKSLQHLIPGELRIPEPPPDAEELQPGGADVVLIPGRAFDATGNRLGRGAGGYDSWILEARAWANPPRFIGVAYECQIVRAVPMEAHDQKMDMVVTARGELR
jgi:5-formyltetrahydrofolate cyclo-ligase